MATRRQYFVVGPKNEVLLKGQNYLTSLRFANDIRRSGGRAELKHVDASHQASNQSEAKVTRNAEIVDAVASGSTLSEVARRHGMTPMRVRQILDRERERNPEKFVVNKAAKLLTERETAEMLGMSVTWLQKDRSATGKHLLPYIKLGGAVRYDQADVWKVLMTHKRGAHTQRVRP